MDTVHRVVDLRHNTSDWRNVNSLARNTEKYYDQVSDDSIQSDRSWHAHMHDAHVLLCVGEGTDTAMSE